MNLIKFPKQKKTFEAFLYGMPAGDYGYQDTAYDEQIKIAVAMIRNAEYVLIGAGAGMSTAAGVQYGGKFSQLYRKVLETKQWALMLIWQRV